MSGPMPWNRPCFPTPFVEEAQGIVRRRTVAYQLRQRAQLVLLLQADPLLSNSRAAAAGSSILTQSGTGGGAGRWGSSAWPLR